MTKPAPDYLRLYRERTEDTAAPVVPSQIPALNELFAAFEVATGWSLEFGAERPSSTAAELIWSAPVDPGVGTTLGHLSLGLAATDDDHAEIEPAVELPVARRWARATAGIIDELLQTRRALREREAELAAGVPMVARPAEKQHLADRLEAILRSAAESIGCTSAALYLLDESTTQLNTRSGWNLPANRFTQPPRELAQATGDLEALCGHAVVLQNERAVEFWCPPEPCLSAVCVPISTANTPLGTLWIFSDKLKDYSDPDVNIVEMAAGRLAAELEREMLVAASVQAGGVQRQLASAERIQQNQLPTIAPLVDGWEVAGWTAQAGQLGGDFHDWWLRGDDRLLVAVGDCLDGGVDGALCASSVRATLRAWGQQPFEPHQLLARANQALWCGSAGDQYAGLLCAAITPSTGMCNFAAAGNIGSLIFANGNYERLTAPMLALGTDPAGMYLPRELTILAGQVLVIVTDGVHEAIDEQGRQWTTTGLAEIVRDQLHLHADALVDLIRDRLEARGPVRADRTVLVVKRTH